MLLTQSATTLRSGSTTKKRLSLHGSVGRATPGAGATSVPLKMAVVPRRDGILVQAQAAGLIARFKVKAGGPQAAAKSLSGGNLQKFIVGREMERKPAVFVVAQPTWGVDVGAAAQIRGELLALRDAGCALLVVSEELEELFELADRLVVMAGGRLSPPIATRDATVERIGQWMSGLWEPEAAHAAA